MIKRGEIDCTRFCLCIFCCCFIYMVPAAFFSLRWPTIYSFVGIHNEISAKCRRKWLIHSDRTEFISNTFRQPLFLVRANFANVHLLRKNYIKICFATRYHSTDYGFVFFCHSAGIQVTQISLTKSDIMKTDYNGST